MEVKRKSLGAVRERELTFSEIKTGGEDNV